MAKNKVLDATSAIVETLEPLASDERMRVVQAALTVLGEQAVEATAAVGGQAGSASREGGSDGPTEGDAKPYFQRKAPKSKGEELAVAARFREELADAEASTKEELKAVFKAARRNFDDHNFRRDIENARTKGLFNKGTGRNSHVLSHYGQGYVDALPDRAALKKVRKPARKKAAKKQPGRS